MTPGSSEATEKKKQLEKAERPRERRKIRNLDQHTQLGAQTKARGIQSRETSQQAEIRKVSGELREEINAE